MSPKANSVDDKKACTLEIETMLNRFCEKYLNEELRGYAVELCTTLNGKRTINIQRGQPEIWAAAIIYVIARLNFLFDKQNEYFITVDVISDFFNAKKSTIGNKATQIEKACNLTIGAEGYCSKEITDAFTFYGTPEGFIIPKSMIRDREIIVEFVEGEAAEEIEKYAENQRKLREQKEQEKKQRRAEINRKIAAEKKAKKQNKNQLNLLDDL
ncbi:MAG: DUF6398 domain-containing protein [bacterium]